MERESKDLFLIKAETPDYATLIMNATLEKNELLHDELTGNQINQVSDERKFRMYMYLPAT